MASTLKALIDRFYPSTPADRVVISGSDYSGKTTMLYLLKLGEIVQTISSIGFNVEDVEIALPSPGKTLNLSAWDIGTGCGGTRFLLTFLRHFLPGAKALIWMLDSARGQDELKESAETLRSVLLMWDFELSEREATQTPLPILILANKTDLPNSLSLDQVRTAFAPVTKGRITSVFQTSLIERRGLTDAFEWLNLALTIAAGSKANAAGSKAADLSAQLREPSVLAKRLEGWLHQTEEDMPAEEFIAKFNAYDLPAWDHYTHIRLAYLILMAHGRQRGKDMIFDGLAKYIENNSQTNGRKYHCSMTYFWIQMVHFGIRNMPPSLVEFKPELGGDQGEAKGLAIQYPSSADFFRFLLVNPHLSDGNLWTDYYSKEVLMSPEAKSGMVLPDKKPLPSLVVRDAITSFGKK